MWERKWKVVCEKARSLFTKVESTDAEVQGLAGKVQDVNDKASSAVEGWPCLIDQLIIS